MHLLNSIKKLTQKLLLTLLVAFPGISNAATLNLGSVPLFLTDPVPANLILNFDDSGSMAWGEIFDSGVTCPFNIVRGCYSSSSINQVHYDPSLVYSPPIDEIGSTYPNASFNGAWIDGYDQIRGTLNLSTSYRVTTDLYRTAATPTNHVQLGASQPAFYQIYNPANAGCPATPHTNFNSNAMDNCFTQVVVSSTSGTGPAGADERQNFANWYAYYRVRILTTKTATSQAFSTLDQGVRVGWAGINRTTSINNANNNYVRAFTGAHRKNFFDWLFANYGDGSTPLRREFETIGQYMRSTDIRNPYAFDPGTTLNPELTCRQSYQVIFSDGQWNNDAGIGGNRDAQNWTLPDGELYRGADYLANPTSPALAQFAPFPDNNGVPNSGADSTLGGHLADNAFYYWATDLRTDLDDDLIAYNPIDTNNPTNDYWNPINDPAKWQHLVNFIITLGVKGNLDPTADYSDILNGTKTWGADHTDDAWHAAINSRGRYFNASSTPELVTSFVKVLSHIAEREASASPVDLDGAEIATASNIFVSGFSSKGWTGTLQSKEFSSGTVGNIVFDASCILTGGTCPDPSSIGSTVVEPGLNWSTDRKIITYDPSATPATGIRFRWNKINASQITHLATKADGSTDSDAQNRLEYLRGRRSMEEDQTGGIFRVRKSLLGDIIHSGPVHVGKSPRPLLNKGAWLDKLHSSIAIPENSSTAQSFDAFALINDSRSPVIYTGANDGMLHAFDTATGRELFGYIPNTVFKNLSKLTTPAFVHSYFVDGLPTYEDVFYNDNWHSAVIGSLNGGGQAVYAIDATTAPTSSTPETAMAQRVRWEFTHNDLGYLFGRPEIVRMHNGKWAAVFGNGFNNSEADGSASATGNASIFIVEIETGNLIKQIDTGAGTTGTPNGITSILPLDFDGDYIVDYFYAGDLEGNLWKFDVRSTSTADWKVAYGDSATSPSVLLPLAKAIDGSSNPQPIMGRPTAISNGPNDFIILFGTGKYVETTDSTLNTSNANSFYGILDKDANNTPSQTSYTVHTPISRTNASTPLQQQTISETTKNGTAVRSITGTAVDYNNATTPQFGWHIDLDPGELQFTDSLNFGPLSVFTTFIPNASTCKFGGKSWFFAFNARNGLSESFTTIDINNDGVFTDTDDGQFAAMSLDPGTVAPLKLYATNVVSSFDSSTGESVESHQATVYGSQTDSSTFGTNIQYETRASTGGLYSGRVKWRQLK